MNNTLDTPIFLIGGAAGTGKTTLARSLSHEIGLVHRIGTGFIREVTRCFLCKRDYPELFEYSFKSGSDRSSFEQLVKQTIVLKAPIERCIKRALQEGTSLVIEGTHIVPGCIDPRYTTAFLVLYQPDEAKHRRMFTGDSHSKRSITQQDFLDCRSVQEELMRAAEQHAVPLIDSTSEYEALEQIKELARNKP